MTTATSVSFCAVGKAVVNWKSVTTERHGVYHLQARSTRVVSKACETHSHRLHPLSAPVVQGVIESNRAACQRHIASLGSQRLGQVEEESRTGSEIRCRPHDRGIREDDPVEEPMKRLEMKACATICCLCSGLWKRLRACSLLKAVLDACSLSHSKSRPQSRVSTYSSLQKNYPTLAPFA